MGYHFIGVFIERPEKSEKELEELFDGYARTIQSPFTGAIVSLRELGEDDIKAHILEKSQHLPNSKIAYINYETWGGMLDYVHGFACCNGVLIENSERCTEDEGEPDGNAILMDLQEIVGARVPRSNFDPFERGFFPNT